jgi:hypothetical protein
MVVPEEDAVSEREVVESVTGETLANEGCARKAPCSGHKRAPTGNHAPMETTARETTGMHSATTKAATEVHSATTESTVHATKSTTAAKCHCWRWKSEYRSEHGRGKATEEFAFHDSGPPPKKCIFVAGRRRGRGSRRRETPIKIQINNQTKVLK